MEKETKKDGGAGAIISSGDEQSQRSHDPCIVLKDTPVHRTATIHFICALFGGQFTAGLKGTMVNRLEYLEVQFPCLSRVIQVRVLAELDDIHAKNPYIELPNHPFFGLYITFSNQ